MVAKTLARDGDGYQRTPEFACSACTFRSTGLRIEVSEDKIDDVVYVDKGHWSEQYRVCSEADEWGATGGRRMLVRIESIRATVRLGWHIHCGSCMT